MTLDLFAFEMLSGQRLTPLPAVEKSWKVAINSDESVTCTIPMNDPGVRKLRLWETTSLARNGLFADVDGQAVAGGPIWKRHLSEKEGTMELTAGGLRSYFDRRVLVPVSARTGSLILPDGSPDPQYDTVLTNLSDGTIAKRWVQLAQAWPGGAVPVVFPQADEIVPGRIDTKKAIDLKNLRTIIDDLTELEGGPDIEFRIRYNANRSGVEWVMRYGTTATPRLGNTDAAAIEWNYGAPLAAAYELEVDEDATETSNQAWASGGAGDDKVIIARAELAKLLDQGYPLLETVDSGNSSVTRQSTMQSKANRAVDLGQYVASFWKMRVRARQDRAPRLLSDFWVGDQATIVVDKLNPFGMPPGKTVRRIASISGDEKNDDYEIAFGEVLV